MCLIPQILYHLSRSLYQRPLNLLNKWTLAFHDKWFLTIYTRVFPFLIIKNKILDRLLTYFKILVVFRVLFARLFNHV